MLRAILTLLLLATTAGAQTPQSVLTIGTREAPPFAMKTDDGNWTGISIDLLGELAKRLGVRYRLVETDLAGMIDGVADGRLNASIAAMTITAERENRIDFSHPFFRTGLGIAVRRVSHGGIDSVLRALTSRGFLATIGLLAALLFVVGAIAWAAERRKNPGMFEKAPARGLLSGFWWAAVTMTTVGYGDKVPVTVLGRLVGVVWMFAALLLTAIFTAQLTAALTAASLNSAISSPDDLARVRVGAVDGAASNEALLHLGARAIAYPGVEEGLAALADGRIDAFVHDRPILLWHARDVANVTVTPFEFAPQDYGIVLPENAPLRETVNRALLAILDEDVWPQIQRRYLGLQD